MSLKGNLFFGNEHISLKELGIKAIHCTLGILEVVFMAYSSGKCKSISNILLLSTNPIFILFLALGLSWCKLQYVNMQGNAQ